MTKPLYQTDDMVLWHGRKVRVVSLINDRADAKLQGWRYYVQVGRERHIWSVPEWALGRSIS